MSLIDVVVSRPGRRTTHSHQEKSHCHSKNISFLHRVNRLPWFICHRDAQWRGATRTLLGGDGLAVVPVGRSLASTKSSTQKDWSTGEPSPIYGPIAS